MIEDSVPEDSVMRGFRRLVAGLVVVLVLLIGWSAVASAMRNLEQAIAPVPQSELSQDRIYAYRDWQSVGVRVKKGDKVIVQSTGSWLYTPGDYHGPEGHPRFLAPSFYPVSGPGGALIGRIGEHGMPFYWGHNIGFAADREGLLYFRINDDVLSDNDGFVTVDVMVTQQ